MRGEHGYAIRISKDGAADLWVKGSRGKLRVLASWEFAFDVANFLRPTFQAGQYAAVVPLDHVPDEVRR